MAKTTLEDLAKVFKTKEPKKDFHYYGQIVSVDRENRTYEVSINRDESITVEAARLVGAGVGDTVMVTVMANGYATVTGRVGGDMDASDAQRTADNASDAASSALSKANSAVGTASQAQNKAVEALGIANNAVELAEQAEEEAGRASTAATQAAASASSAEADASRAATSAQNAEADASSASTSAQNAAASASSASTSASNAATSAQNAASDAASAATSASNAEADASSAATSAQNAATSAQSAASDASSASSSATAAAADAATARQQSSAATTAANEAKTQAQAAETAANEAKADASSAKRDAAAANTAANGAVAGLAVVQGVVDQLETDVDDMQTHVAMMNAIDEGDVHIPAGLHVVPSASGYFMVIANDGVYVYDNESVLVAKYGHNIVYDSNREHKIGNNTSYIRYYDSNNDGVADAIEIVADNIRLGSYSVGDKITATETTLNNYMSSNNTRVGNVETSVTTTTTNLTNYITSNNQAIENLQGQIDGSIQTWFYEVVPTNNNPPANSWTTTDLKNNHLGDLYYDTITGYCYRYQVQNNVYGWQRITDVDVTKALADAAKAQDTADHKRRVFVTTPAPPYEIGDLWVQGQNGDIFRCATPKTSQQSYDAADWVKASKYTDDTKANAVESDLHTNYYVKSDFSVAPDRIASTISATETTVKTYADGKASAAESNAKTYADGKASTAETNAKTYADGKASAAESNAKTYADNNFDSKGSAASALDDAKDYADDNFDSKGSASAAQAAAISAAAADATSKANAAESNAKADTANKLTSYYTKTQTDSAITQSANSILSTVSTTYQTKDDMDDYSTTAEMNSAINQKADSITSTVAQTYATKTQAQGYADTAESNAKADTANKLQSYYTKTETVSEIEQRAEEISISVTKEIKDETIYYYLASNKSSGVKITDPGWTRTSQTTTDEKPYLWVYAIVATGSKTEPPEPTLISGPIVSFESEAADLPLNKLEIKIDPQQDLHGYDRPWAPGGGKNLIDIADGSITTTTNLLSKELAAGAYTFSAYGKREDGGQWRVLVSKMDGTAIEAGAASSGTVLQRNYATFTLAETTSVRLQLQFLSSYSTLQYENVQLELGSAATAYEPYSNVCPISGCNEVELSLTGKNLFDNNFAHYTRPVDYRILPIDLKQGETYTFSVKLTGTAVTGCTLGFVKAGARYFDFQGFNIFINAEGRIPSYTQPKYTVTVDASFTAPALVVYARDEAAFNSLFENYEIQLEVGNRNTEYEPYTDGTKSILYDGINVWDEEWEVGWIRTDGSNAGGVDNIIRSVNYIPVTPNTDYYFNVPDATDVIYFDVNKNSLGNYDKNGNGDTSPTSKIRCTQENCHYIRFWVRNQTTYNNDISINYPSTEHDYHPYTAGTVYGGTIDVLTGLMTVDRAYLCKNTADMNTSEEYPGWHNSGVKDIVGADKNTLFNDGVLNIGVDYGANTTGVSDTLILPVPKYGKTKSEWQELAMDIQFALPLEEPQTIQLTPHQINTFLGQNNIWANAGDTTVEYWSRAIPSALYLSGTDDSTDGEKIVSRINLQPETVKIEAKNVEIDGTVTFNAIKSQADAAYDSKGSASTAEQNAKGYADGKASTAEQNAKGYADGLADDLETAALSRSQRIYYRSTSIQNLDSFSGPTTWLSTSGTGYENWSLSIPQLTNGEDSYPYLYTCVQNQTAAQYAAGSVCTCTPVVCDDSTTVIDGGSITTGQILARHIETTGLSINSTQVNDLDDLLATKQNAGNYITDSDLDDRISDIVADVNTLNGHILFGDDGRNTFILLQNYDKDNPETITGVQAKLTSDKLAFGTFGSVDNEVAYFSSEELKVQKRLSFGNFVMKQRDNGHLSIMFEGGDD